MTDQATRLVVYLDADARDLLVEALRSDSTRRQRAATRAAAELHAEREAGRRDIRSGAVMVTNLLVDAARLDDAAAAIQAAPLVEDIRVAARVDVSPAVTALREAGAAVEDLADLVEHRGPPADRRTDAEALAEAHEVLQGLGMTFDGTEPDEFDDGRLPEDEPDPDEVAAMLTPTTPAQE